MDACIVWDLLLNKLSNSCSNATETGEAMLCTFKYMTNIKYFIKVALKDASVKGWLFFFFYRTDATMYTISLRPKKF